MYEQLLKKLDDAGNIGADLSPGDPMAREAAEVIRELLDEVQHWRDVANLRHKWSLVDPEWRVEVRPGRIR